MEHFHPRLDQAGQYDALKIVSVDAVYLEILDESFQKGHEMLGSPDIAWNSFL